MKTQSDFKTGSAPLSSSVAPELIFYDGQCGLCHGFVRFLLKHDRTGKSFRFAPLGGKTFRRVIAEEIRLTLPDSIVLLSHSGNIHTRSAAVIHILSRLDGTWPILAKLLSIFPRLFSDFVYDLLARIRHLLSSQPKDICPVMPQDLRSRFDE